MPLDEFEQQVPAQHAGRPGDGNTHGALPSHDGCDAPRVPHGRRAAPRKATTPFSPAPRPERKSAAPAGATADYNTPVGTVDVPAGGPHALTLTSSGLDGAKTYLLAVRARTSGGVEDTNTDTVSVTTDAVAPTALTLTATVD